MEELDRFLVGGTGDTREMGEILRLQPQVRNRLSREKGICSSRGSGLQVGEELG